MSFLTILMIAIGLSMDSLSVSVASGIFMSCFRFREAAKIAFILAAFQGVLTFVGWALGINFSTYINSVDHWIAFVLLAYLGGKMIYEALRGGDEESGITSLSTKRIMTLGLATSIDAMAVGVGMAFLKTTILYPVIIICATTFVFSFLGLFFGCKFGKMKFINIELVGGAILVGIGIKILLEHTVLA